MVKKTIKINQNKMEKNIVDNPEYESDREEYESEEWCKTENIPEEKLLSWVQRRLERIFFIW